MTMKACRRVENLRLFVRSVVVIGLFQGMAACVYGSAGEDEEGNGTPIPLSVSPELLELPLSEMLPSCEQVITLSRYSSPRLDGGVLLLRQARRPYQLQEVTLTDPNMSAQNYQAIKKKRAFYGVKKLTLVGLRFHENLKNILNIFPYLEEVTITGHRLHKPACASPRGLFSSEGSESSCAAPENDLLKRRYSFSEVDERILLKGEEHALKMHMIHYIKYLGEYFRFQEITKKLFLKTIVLPLKMVAHEEFQEQLTDSYLNAFEVSSEIREERANGMLEIMSVLRRKPLVVEESDSGIDRS